MNAPKSSRHGKKAEKPSPRFSLEEILAALLIVLFGAFFLWHQFGIQESSTQRELVRNGIADEISVPEKVTPQQEVIPQEAKTAPAADYATTSSSTAKTIIAATTDHASTATTISQQTTQYSAAEKTAGRHVGQTDAKTTGSKQPLDTSSQPSPPPTPSADQKPIAAAEAVLLNGTCEQSAEEIHQFYQHLDNQKYMEKYDLRPSSEHYFNTLIQELIDNPPVVSGETDDLFTILKNTAHFFRVIGKQNIGMLKEILNNEHDQFENIFARYYTIIHSPQCFIDHFNLALSDPALYNYAGFFLSTMGGRLYLFRRDSRSRMVISYYAILLIDRANAHSSNKHGIEISNSIDLLIDEMESTVDTLLLKERYLDTLYTLKEQYQ
jgi:hypothetical protein